MAERDCFLCQGNGHDGDDVCPDCNGSGLSNAAVVKAREEREEAIVSAFTAALRGKPVDVSHVGTGGGCTAWEVTPQGRDPQWSLLLTGSADETEATSDLWAGVMLGVYDLDSEYVLIPGVTDDDDVVAVIDADPQKVADAVVAAVDFLLAHGA